MYIENDHIVQDSSINIAWNACTVLHHKLGPKGEKINGSL